MGGDFCFPLRPEEMETWLAWWTSVGGAQAPAGASCCLRGAAASGPMEKTRNSTLMLPPQLICHGAVCSAGTRSHRACPLPQERRMPLRGPLGSSGSWPVTWSGQGSGSSRTGQTGLPCTLVSLKSGTRDAGRSQSSEQPGFRGTGRAGGFSVPVCSLALAAAEPVFLLRDTPHRVVLWAS